MAEKAPQPLEPASMHLETPVIDVRSDGHLSNTRMKVTPSLEGETHDDEGELEEAIAAIERLERSMRFTN